MRHIIKDIIAKKRVIKKSIVILLAVLGTWGLLSCADDSTTTTTAKTDTTLTGTLSYNPAAIIGISVGSAEATSEATLVLTGESIGQTVEYSILPQTEGVTIDKTSGTITVASTAAITKADYTVSATATGANFVGSIEATINIEVSSGPPTVSSLGFLNYPSIVVGAGNTAEVLPNWTRSPDPSTDVTYSITDGATTLPAGIDLDTTTGKISVATTAAQQDATTYTITATAKDGGLYTGSATAEVSVKIQELIPIAGGISYGPFEAIEGTAETGPPPRWARGEEDLEDLTVTYSISPATAGISIDTEGRITIGADAAAAIITEYEVTATGSGIYGGSVSAKLDILILPKNTPTFTLVVNNTADEAIDSVLVYPTGTGNPNAGMSTDNKLNGDTIPSGSTKTLSIPICDQEVDMKFFNLDAVTLTQTKGASIDKENITCGSTYTANVTELIEFPEQ